MPIRPLLSVSLSSTVYTWLAGWGVFEDPLQPATTALGIRIQGTSPLSPWALVCIREGFDAARDGLRFRVWDRGPGPLTPLAVTHHTPPHHIPVSPLVCSCIYRRANTR
jgi:hypothetical protein